MASERPPDRKNQHGIECTTVFDETLDKLSPSPFHPLAAPPFSPVVLVFFQEIFSEEVKSDATDKDEQKGSPADTTLQVCTGYL